MRQNLRLIISTAVVAVTFASSGELVPHSNNERELSGLCHIIEDGFFGGSATCTCNIPILQGKGDVSCSKEFCGHKGKVCGEASFATSFTLFPPALSAKVCLDKIVAKIHDFTSSEYGPFCIDFGTAVARSACTNGLYRCITSGKALKVKQERIVTECKATIAGEKCTACTPCDTSGGVTFDCSNIIPGFKIDTCAKFEPWLGAGSKTNANIPDLEFTD